MSEIAGWAPQGVPQGMVIEHAHYDNAPIIEAILEFRVSDAGDLSPTLASFCDGASGWEGAEVSPIFSRTIELNNTGESRVQSNPIGHSILRADGARRITVMTDRIAYSWIGQYETWEALVDEALPMFWKYRDDTGATQLVRLACRFVNVIRMRSPHSEVRDYLRTSVDVSPYLPQGLESFFMQATVGLGDNLGVNVTSAAPANFEEGQVGVALDLDTFDSATLDLTTDWVVAEMNSKLDMLRMAKNYVFEASITDATRGLIK